ncbi:hypothetical protein TCAL_11298 [Tigriopus californicus]|uniref:Transcription factor CBF/NF-Y/archaeal histone domain-containing protein n=1 Tax=Tigriopus californicus TaxID=6832 RepID=A0A553P399_TIGCA|nr:hypothetical protein TCAL_11298 [Tigriopus californicus]
MQSDEEVGKVAAAVPVIISRALELFVETLLKRMDATMTERGARTMTPGHLKLCIHSEPRFDFLKDLVLDVPDLAPDNGEESLTPQPCALSASSTTGRTTNGTPRAPRLPRQISTVKSSLLGEAQAEAQAEDDAGPTNRSSANLIPHIPPSPKRGATSKSVKTSSHGAMDLSSSLGSTSPGSNHLLSSHTQTNPPSSFGMTGPPLNLVLSRGLGCNEDEDDDYDS